MKKIVADEKKIVKVHAKDKSQKPWTAIVLQEGKVHSIIKWIDADEILVGKTTCVMNSSLTKA